MLRLACAAPHQPSVCGTVSALIRIQVLMGTSNTLEDLARMTIWLLTFVPSTALLVGSSQSPGCDRLDRKREELHQLSLHL